MVVDWRKFLDDAARTLPAYMERKFGERVMLYQTDLTAEEMDAEHVVVGGERLRPTDTSVQTPCSAPAANPRPAPRTQSTETGS